MPMPDIFPSTPSFKLFLDNVDSVKCSHASYTFSNCLNNRILSFPSSAAYANELQCEYDDAYEMLEVGCLGKFKENKLRGHLWLVKTKDGMIHPWIKINGWTRFIWAGPRIKLEK